VVFFKKSKQPNVLVQYKQRKGVSYDEMDTSVRTAVLRQLLKDQHGLCAYCNGVINEENMRVEHWEAQSVSPMKDLDFKNFLGVCSGDRYQCEPRNEHCDRSKGKREINYHPSRDRQIDETIKYTSKGEIFSDEADWNDQLRAVLYLNCGRLPSARLSKLNGFIQALRKKQSDGNWNPAFIMRGAQRVLNLDREQWPEYIGIVLYYCRKKR